MPPEGREYKQGKAGEAKAGAGAGTAPSRPARGRGRAATSGRRPGQAGGLEEAWIERTQAASAGLLTKPKLTAARLQV